MAFEKCPNCKQRIDGASVYQCSNCDIDGCMKGAMGGYFGPYDGCWTGEKCPNCGFRNTKEYVGMIVVK